MRLRLSLLSLFAVAACASACSSPEESPPRASTPDASADVATDVSVDDDGTCPGESGNCIPSCTGYEAPRPGIFKCHDRSFTCDGVWADQCPACSKQEPLGCCDACGNRVMPNCDGMGGSCPSESKPDWSCTGPLVTRPCTPDAGSDASPDGADGAGDAGAD